VAVDLTTLDAKIRRLQKLRELLTDEDTRELLSDPDTVAFIQQSRNGNGARSVPAAESPIDSDDEEDRSSLLPGEGSFRRKVLEIAEACAGKFDARYILGKLNNSGHHFDADNPMIAVNTALRALQRKELVRLVRAGSGRQPHIYEAVRKEGESQK